RTHGGGARGYVAHGRGLHRAPARATPGWPEPSGSIALHHWHPDADRRFDLASSTLSPLRSAGLVPGGPPDRVAQAGARIMRYPIFVAAMLLALPKPVPAQSITFDMGRLLSDPDWSTYRLGFARSLTGALGSPPYRRPPRGL